MSSVAKKFEARSRTTQYKRVVLQGEIKVSLAIICYCTDSLILDNTAQPLTVENCIHARFDLIETNPFIY